MLREKAQSQRQREAPSSEGRQGKMASPYPGVGPPLSRLKTCLGLSRQWNFRRILWEREREPEKENVTGGDQKTASTSGWEQGEDQVQACVPPSSRSTDITSTQGFHHPSLFFLTNNRARILEAIIFICPVAFTSWTLLHSLWFKGYDSARCEPYGGPQESLPHRPRPLKS